MFFEAIWLVFLISFGLQLFYYLYFFRRLAFFKAKRTVSQDQRSVSVVVCAHNEEHELPNLLAALCRQNVETFELVLVDDASTDGTAELIDRSDLYPRRHGRPRPGRSQWPRLDGPRRTYQP